MSNPTRKEILQAVVLVVALAASVAWAAINESKWFGRSPAFNHPPITVSQ